MRKTIASAFDKELPPELHSGIAHAVWMQTCAMSDRGRRFDFWTEPDGGKALDKELDADGDRLGENARWSSGR
ncbi:hypothetical protein [Nocardia brevicatena]|uniref:hypothetical protein n=1 Tax=Nocardia brevicatena TaxID=37327 RepID=UPI000309E349|nr:hypothetical protein [Nocardia brevicatena]